MSGGGGEELKEKLKQPAWVWPHERQDARIRLQLYWAYGMPLGKPPLEVARQAYGSPYTALMAQWTWTQDQKAAALQAAAERASEALPEPPREAPERSYPAKDTPTDEEEVMHANWSFNQAAQRDEEYQEWLTLVEPQAVSTGSAPASPASDAPASNDLGQTLDASPPAEPESSEPQ